MYSRQGRLFAQCWGTLAAPLVLCSAGSASAQSEPDTGAATGLPAAAAVTVTAPAPVYRQFDKIEITGSAILAKEAKKSLPIQVIDQREIERLGAQDLGQLMQKLPVMLNFLELGSVPGTVFGGPNAGAIHGNQSGTLVLLNGRRLPYYGSPLLGAERAVVDLNVIPLAALERIELLTDGASSRYGSDAVAGVVNIITKSRESGVTLSAEYLRPDQGKAQGRTANLSWGAGRLERDGYGVRAYFTAQKQDMLMAGDREPSRREFLPVNVNGKLYWSIPYGGSKYTAPAQNYTRSDGSYGNTQIDATGQCLPGWLQLEPGQCYQDLQSRMTLYPSQSRLQGYVQGEKMLSDGWQVSGEALWTGYHQDFLPTGVPLTTALDAVQGDRTYAFAAAPLGLLEQRYNNNLHQATVGLKGELAGWSVVSHLSTGEHQVHRGYTNGRPLSGYRSVALTPEELAQQPSEYSSATLAKFEPYRQVAERVLDDAFTRQQSLGVLASGELAETTYGPVMLGTGLDWRNESVAYRSPSASRPSLSGARRNWALHGELQLPVAPELETSVAFRHDQYSDFGGVGTGKVSGKWTPDPAWLFRASYGTGFRAPTIAQMLPVASGFGGNGSQDVRFVGNPDLKPERSQQASLGTRFEPNRQWTLGADYWRLQIRDIFGRLDLQQVLDDPLLRARYVDEQQQPWLVTLPNTNIGSTVSSGIDYDVQWRQPLDAGRLRVLVKGTHYLSSKRQAAEGAEQVSNLGEYDPYRTAVVPRNQLSIMTVWEQAQSSYAAVLHYRSGYYESAEVVSLQDDSSTFVRNKVAGLLILDLRVRRELQRGLTVSAGLTNVFNKLPGIVFQTQNTGNGYDTRIASYYGRTLGLKAEYKF